MHEKKKGNGKGRTRGNRGVRAGCWHKALKTDAVTPLEEENRKVAYRAALEGIVLLENDGCLPVKPGKIALYGAGAGMTIKGGTGSGEVHERHAVTILEGLEKAGFEVTTKNWINAYAKMYREGEEAFGEEIRKKIHVFTRDNIMKLADRRYSYPFGPAVREEDIRQSGTDTCVYVVARQAGEGADRKLDNHDYMLSEVERENIRLCGEKYEKMIVAINTGSSFDMGFLDEISGINAVVFFAQQGTMGGQAFADLLSGKETPSGKLTDTWALKYENIPYAMEYSYLNGNLDEEYYKEGIYVGYRYFDTVQAKPRYPFGYGLSYTPFDVRVKSVMVTDTRVNVRAEVTNGGTQYGGREVVQVYVCCPNGKLDKEYQRLAAFGKTRKLAPGETESLELSFDMEDLTSFREQDGADVLEKGYYFVRVGNSSRATKIAAVLVLDQEVVVARHDHICVQEKTHDDLSLKRQNPEILPPNASVIPVHASAFQTKAFEYGTPEEASSKLVERLLEVMKPEEIAELTVGGNMSGKRFFEAPGSAGATSPNLLHRGIPNVSLADGPAGLRLLQRATIGSKGKVKGVEPEVAAVNYLPKLVKKRFVGNPDKEPVIYQFTTAFPVGLALAQTWNMELVEEVGDAVGREMEAYGVAYWLAPALNIHRNPLCGRSFEYFSEDPLLSGKLAAAMCRGVQSHRGCYVTIKHLCCNNQEDNRTKTNANVSERALREIYLRGFEIAVKEGNPGAVMTSYNKVNGVYTSNSYDLVTKVLRNEWGFHGLVMTDWYATGKGVGSHIGAIAAGNDLIMPGGNQVVRTVVKAMKSGRLREEDVRRSASRVLQGIVSTRTWQGYLRSH